MGESDPEGPGTCEVNVYRRATTRPLELYRHSCIYGSQYLDSLGCGRHFIKALQASMSATGMIGSESFTTSAGEKQGGSSSCSLFTSYIDPTIAAVKSTGPDGWLDDLHIILFMDDTVLFATSRDKLLS